VRARVRRWRRGAEMWWLTAGRISWPLRIISRAARRRHAESVACAHAIRKAVIEIALHQAISEAAKDGRLSIPTQRPKPSRPEQPESQP
jgi:hypothetical protein